MRVAIARLTGNDDLAEARTIAEDLDLDCLYSSYLPEESGCRLTLPTEEAAKAITSNEIRPFLAGLLVAESRRERA